jgi:uncharacterized delta-60 repeat protein
MTRKRQRQYVLPPFLLLPIAMCFAGVWFAALTASVYAAAGDLDPSFDRDGRQVFSSTSDDRGFALALQNDGKIIIAGDTDFLGASDVLLLRFNVGGSPDLTFNTTGRRIYNEPEAEDHGRAVTVQPNGRIVVAGYSNLFGTNDVLLLRFHANGSLDLTFDNDGRRIFSSANSDDRAFAVAVQPGDGKIVVAGYTNLLGTNDVLVMRFNANGSVDTTFDSDGRVVINGPGNDIGQALALQADGKIVVAGYTNVLGDNDFLVVRLNVNGSLDGTFNGDGRQIIRGFGGNDRAQAVRMQSDGKIILAGYTNAAGNNDFAVARLNANGSLDVSFDVDGRQIVNGFGGDDRAQAVAVQPDGKIVLAGYTNAAGNNDFALARLTPNGSLDAAFGVGGRVVTRGFGGDDRAQAVAIQPTDGKIVAAGYTNGLGTNDVAVARYLAR